MNYRQNNKLSMYLSVQKTCRSNPSAWSMIPAAVRSFTEFEQCIERIQIGLRSQTRPVVGVSLDKRGSRKDLAEKAYTIAQAVVAYAREQKNMELIALVDHSLTDWMKTPSNLAKEMVEHLLQAVQPLTAQLADYGVSADDVMMLEALLNAHLEKIGAPRTAIVQRRTATQSLEEHFNRSEELCKNIDGLFLQLKTTEFYKNYKNSRKMVNLRPRRDALLPVVTTAEKV